jgi:hypothetical protein
MKIICRTFFDCSATGVTGHFRPSQVPFSDHTGTVILDQRSWNYARNQQRNWETLTQLISLRTQPVSVNSLGQDSGTWSFEFEVESSLVYSTTGQEDDISGLVNECAGVPMITGLKETHTQDTVLVTQGADQNIWFVPINTSLETAHG